MNTLLAREQLTADAGMSDLAVAQDRPGYGYRSLRVVGGFTEQPLVFPVARVPRNDRPRATLESVDSARVPVGNAVARQVFCLLTDCVACRESLERCENSTLLGYQLPTSSETC
jgi:hypothetical protein